ncbi:MAG: Re/Si-specific NAD(P)(+) transhydrogenase subunit alpha [Armatimonadetes bacterium]|nr:Re/Si-specific NAD(P)(+) transhydrogenase subunit alpha [Armatimonadota bacterium]
MIIAVPKETTPGERRVALAPDGVRALVARGAEVLIERDAGHGASIANAAYETAGARVSDGEVLSKADMVLQVSGPTDGYSGTIQGMSEGSALVAFMFPQSNLETVLELKEKRITCFAMDLMPRISRAQAMDALSSMSTIAGYKSVLLAAAELPKFFPMLMTAAGSIAPARVLVIGAGVAGLQAIATARRLGAIVEAFDVRPAVKEQVESLGAKYVDLGLSSEEAEDAGGYAKEVSSDTHVHELKVIAQQLPKSDVVITTALIPGRPAPKLITEEMVRTMARGSVIVDLAAANGGNCELSVPGQTVQRFGVSIIGLFDMPSSMAVHASQMYSKNITAFVSHVINDGELDVDLEDAVTRGALLTHDGKIMHEPTRLLIEKGIS